MHSLAASDVQRWSLAAWAGVVAQMLGFVCVEAPVAVTGAPQRVPVRLGVPGAVRMRRGLHDGQPICV
ncbi:hypothetical protein J7E89_39655 [Streptomyces sp. ISL-100]|nr:hypothetical protein [Streptomyces sp. ISL-100]